MRTASVFSSLVSPLPTRSEERAFHDGVTSSAAAYAVAFHEVLRPFSAWSGVGLPLRRARAMSKDTSVVTVAPSASIRRPPLRAARLASPGLVPSPGFLTLLTVCSPPYPSDLVASRPRRNATTKFMPVSLLGFGSPPELFPETAAVTPLDVRNPRAVGLPVLHRTSAAQTVMTMPIANQHHRLLCGPAGFPKGRSTPGHITAVRVAIPTVTGLRSKLRRTVHVTDELALLDFGPPQGFSPPDTGLTASSLPPPMSLVSDALRHPQAGIASHRRRLSGVSRNRGEDDSTLVDTSTLSRSRTSSLSSEVRSQLGPGS
jgi:hypothetical protein